MAEWDKHLGDDDKMERLQFQMRLTLDGTVRFIYKNMHQVDYDDTKRAGTPVLIGLQDGFSAPADKEDGKHTTYLYSGMSFLSNIVPAEINVFTYPKSLVDLEDIAQNHYNLYIEIKFEPVEGLCRTQRAEDCKDECTRCSDICIYSMELHRPGGPCNKDGNVNRKFCYMKN